MNLSNNQPNLVIIEKFLHTTPSEPRHLFAVVEPKDPRPTLPVMVR